MTNLPVPVAVTTALSWNGATVPALVAAAGERASVRFLEFFAAQIRNPHTRRAYYRAAEEFLAWCKAVGVPPGCRRPAGACRDVDRDGAHELAAPTVKQRLAGLRHLFDCLVSDQVMLVNLAHSVRGMRSSGS